MPRFAHRRRAGLLAVALAGAAVAALVVLVLALGDDDERRFPVPPPVAGGREVVLQDDAVMLFGKASEVRRSARLLAKLGVDRVRLNAGWSGTAPDPHGERRPAFDAADPDAYPKGAWASLDRAVIETVRAGMRPMLDVGFWAPRWAVARRVGRPDRQRYSPSPEEFARFAGAVARRYDGEHDLPAVRLYTTWNEPNHPAFLLPQWVRRDGRWLPESPHHYREMHERAYRAIKSVSAENRVLVGGLTSLGSTHPGETHSMPPLRFVRELACVDRALRPLARPECRGFRPIRADGFAHHPYSFTAPPDVPAGSADSVTMADLGKLTRLLRRLHERGRMAGPLGLWLTEYGYETNPPDARRGVSPARQAAYMSQATSIALAHPEVRSFAQFLLRDVVEPGDADPSAGYQTGLLFADGRPKPALFAFAVPFHAQREGNAVRAFGQVRPGNRATRVTLERRGQGGNWRALGPSFATQADGSFRRRLPGPGTYRFLWAGHPSPEATVR